MSNMLQNKVAIVTGAGRAVALAYAAEAGLAHTAALAYSARGIRVNTAGPAFIKTLLLDNLPPQMFDAPAALHPIGCLGQPEEVAEVAELMLWLSPDKASFVSGAYYPIDGGYLSQ
jgi:NAD(P)-dependent dehydrogenase (short-subunit alcohol dehydrogenase family)